MKKDKIKYWFSFILIIFAIYIVYTLITNIYFEMFKLKNKEQEAKIVERLSTEIPPITTENTTVKRDLKYIGDLKGYNVIAILRIPKINLESKVLEEYNEKSLKISVTKFFGPAPNEVGNFCISGHNYRTNSNNMFRDLKKIETNDLIYLSNGYNEEITYKVYETFKVLPKETKSLSQRTNGRREITLITCTLNSRERIIIKAREI